MTQAAVKERCVVLVGNFRPVRAEPNTAKGPAQIIPLAAYRGLVRPTAESSGFHRRPQAPLPRPGGVDGSIC